MSQVYEEDILNAGKNQVIISNDNTKVIIIPDLGGRIVDIQTGETNFLHRTYPKGVDFGPYTEYGGIEECIGGAPGTLWNAVWKWDQQDGGVVLQSLSKQILVRKLITLEDEGPIVKIDYDFFNLGNTFSKFTFGIHPEICINGALRDNQYFVPTNGDVLSGGYVEPGFKNKILPSQGWCAITHEGKAFGQMFPEGIVDVVEVYYPKVDTHLVLEPIIFGVGTSPEKYAGFTYMLYLGEGDVGKVKEIRASRDDQLSARYESFDRERLSTDSITELSALVRERERDELEERLRREAKGPILPTTGVPDMDTIAIAIEGYTDMLNQRINVKADTADARADADAPADVAGSGQTEELPPNTGINIKHLKGDITIHGWEKNHIEYDNIRGSIEQNEGNIRIETSGNYSLKIPKGTPKLYLDFVNGNMSIFDVISSLKISGVNGNVNIVSAGLPEGSELDISLVNGNIELSMPLESSFTLSASGSGEITSEIPLDEEERTRSQLKGKLKDGAAKIILGTMKGNISLKPVHRDNDTEESGNE
jgi:hypothetical protein